MYILKEPGALSAVYSEGRADPVVSIILSTFNHELYIQTALNSIFRQKADFDIEVLVFDDKSTDRTLQKIKEISVPKGFSITVFQPEVNLWGTEDTNFAILDLIFSKSKGRYIGFLEGDDFYGDAEKIRKQVSDLVNIKSLGFSFHSVEIVNEHGEFIKSWEPENFRRDYSVSELRNFQYAYIHMSSVLWRKTPVKIPNEVFCTRNTDMLWPYVFAQSGRAKFDRTVGANLYRQSTSGTWSNLTSQERTERKLIFSSLMLNICLKENNYEGARSVLNSRLIQHLQDLAKYI